MADSQEHNQDAIPESSSALWAFYFAFVPILGLIFYIAFAFLGLIQIGKGRTGFHMLGKGLIVVVFLSVLPLAGLLWWAEFPQCYYVVLNRITKHGYIEDTKQGEVVQREYFRFGKSFRLVKYAYHDNGTMCSEGNYMDGKLNGTFTSWYDNGKPRMIETFVNNRRHGLCSWFDKNGNPERTINYTNGISQEQIDAAKKAGVPVTIEEDLGGGVKMKMVFIPPGEFMMGSPDNEQYRSDNEGPQHKVIIKQGFYLCETEVTQAQWKIIMDNYLDNTKNSKMDAPQDTSNHPVVWITWKKIKEYLKKFNDRGKGQFRLPSEAEWEFAARGGTATCFGFGNNENELIDYEWCGRNSGKRTHPVGTRKQNNWGLFDMHGNVEEWCEDDFHDGYHSAPNDEKAWVDSPRGNSRVFRGGSWYSPAGRCRSACRNGGNPVNFGDDLGVRIVRDIPVIPTEK